MKVLVLDAAPPLGPDPRAEWRAALVRRLHAAGAEAEAVVLPFAPDADARQVLAARSLCVFNADRVVAIGFPATLVPHRVLVAWLHDVPREIAAAHRVFAADAAVAAAILRAHGIAAAVLPADADPAPLLA
jgi:hypothetical protein